MSCWFIVRYSLTAVSIIEAIKKNSEWAEKKSWETKKVFNYFCQLGEYKFPLSFLGYLPNKIILFLHIFWKIRTLTRAGHMSPSAQDQPTSRLRLIFHQFQPRNFHGASGANPKAGLELWGETSEILPKIWQSSCSFSQVGTAMPLSLISFGNERSVSSFRVLLSMVGEFSPRRKYRHKAWSSSASKSSFQRLFRTRESRGISNAASGAVICLNSMMKFLKLVELCGDDSLYMLLQVSYDISKTCLLIDPYGHALYLVRFC